jgi:chromosome segregation ATPase
LYGSASKLLTQSFITKLRRDKVVEETLILVDPDDSSQSLEVGRVSLAYKLTVEELEDKIYEDVREIEKNYYDPFTTDESEISTKLSKIESLITKKQKELNDVMEQQDKRVEAMRSLAIDLAMLRKSKGEMEKTNQKLLNELHKRQNVDDVHIQIDILSTTPQGVAQLKEKYAKLIAKFYIERNRHEDLEEEYQKLKPELKKLEKTKSSICEMEKALEEQKFHGDRYNDKLDRIKASKETIMSQEKVIKSLTEYIKEASGSGPKMTAELEMYLQDMNYKRTRLFEKHKQLRLMIELNDGKLPRNYLEKIQSEELEDNPEEVSRLKRQADSLMTRIQEVTNKMDMIKDDFNLNQDYEAIEKWEEEKPSYEIQILQAENRSQTLERQMRINTEKHAKIIADLKHKIAMIQDTIDDRSNLMTTLD